MNNNEKLDILMKKLEKEGMEKMIFINKKYERLSFHQEIQMMNMERQKSYNIIFTLRKYYNILCNTIMKRWNKENEMDETRKYINELEEVISEGAIEFEKEIGRKMTFKEMRMIYG